MNASPTGVIERSRENDEIYRYIRSEIQAELSLVNARVNWLITSQAFLFTPLVIARRGGSVAESALFPFIPHLGIVLCLLVFVAIAAAVWRSYQWRAKYRHSAYDGKADHGVFSIVTPHTPLIPMMGLVGAFGVPVVLAAAWTWLRFWPPGAGS